MRPTRSPATSPQRSPNTAPSQTICAKSSDIQSARPIRSLGVRYDNWKVVFYEQRIRGTLQIWAGPFVELRVPKIFNLCTDPYERADQTSNTYYDWLLDRLFLIVPLQAFVAEMSQSLIEFPQRQKPAAFNLSAVMEKDRGWCWKR